MLKDRINIRLVLFFLLFIFVIGITFYIKTDSRGTLGAFKSNTSDSAEREIVDYNKWYSLRLKEGYEGIILARRHSSIKEPMSVGFYYKKKPNMDFNLATISTVDPKEWKNLSNRRIIGILNKDGKEKILYLQYDENSMYKLDKEDIDSVKLGMLYTIKDNIKAVNGVTLQNENEYDKKIQEEIDDIEAKSVHSQS